MSRARRQRRYRRRRRQSRRLFDYYAGEREALRRIEAWAIGWPSDATVAFFSRDRDMVEIPLCTVLRHLDEGSYEDDKTEETTP